MEKFILKPISGNKIKKGFFRICKEGKKDTLLSTNYKQIIDVIKENVWHFNTAVVVL